MRLTTNSFSSAPSIESRGSTRERESKHKITTKSSHRRFGIEADETRGRDPHGIDSF